MRSIPESQEPPLVISPKLPAAPAPAAPNPAAGFELGDWTKTLPEGLAEKPAEPPITAEEAQEAWDALPPAREV